MDMAGKVARSRWKSVNRKLASRVFGNNRCQELSSSTGGDEKLVAAVVLERLPVVLPPVSPAVSAFRQFSADWQQQFRRQYPKEFFDVSANKGGEYDESAAFEPAAATTDADAMKDQRSLQRALDRRLYLVLHGVSSGDAEGKPVWHFPEKIYSKEPSLRHCAEAAIGSLVGDFSKSVYFVGNAPCGHLLSRTPSLNRFFFRSQLLDSKFHFEDTKHVDYAWISKEEVPFYFEAVEAEFLRKLLR